MKNLKKLGAIVLALVMVLSLSAVAFAEGETAFDSGVAEKKSGETKLDLTNGGITFNVTFKATEDVSLPGTTFNYSVAPGIAKPDAAPIIYAGAANDLTVGTTTFEVGTVKGEEKTQTVKLTIAENAFSGRPAGIYRYTVTQTLSQDQKAVGITNEKGGTGPIVKNLDLYVDKDGKVIDAVLFDTITDLKVENSEINYGTSKNDGFTNNFGKDKDPNAPEDPNPPTDPDTSTHTITLDKVVAGNMGDTSEKFTFTVKTSYEATAGDAGAVNLTGVVYTAVASDAKGKNTATIPTELKIGTDAEFKLSDKECVVITVPNRIKVEIIEGVSEDEGYTVSVATGTDAKLANTIAADAHKDTEHGTTGTIQGQDETVTYTNTRDAISPTGVVLTFAPYFFMMAAAIVLVLFTRRREEEQA